MVELDRAPEIIVYDCGGISCKMSCCRVCFPPDVTIEQMIEKMPQTHICRGGHNIWWAYIEPWGVYEDGKGGSPSTAVRALYEKWKEQE